MAEWREGANRYLLGKLSHVMARSDADRYRCFVWERPKNRDADFIVAQSGEATCNGLRGVRDGAKTMKLTRGT